MPKNHEPQWTLLKLMIAPDDLSGQDIIDLKGYFLSDPAKALGDIRKNLIVIRAYDNLTLKGLNECAAVIKDLRDRECERIDNGLAWIDKLSSFLEERKVGFVFTKALMHYPDMGHDIDLLLLDGSLKIDQVILDAFGGKMIKNSFVNILAGKTGCEIDGCLSPLEIHHGHAGQLGEFAGYVPTIITNKRTVSFVGHTVAVPSLEDELIICVLQRFYSHMYFRITDVVEALRLVRSEKIDWHKVVRTAQSLGISEALGLYLAFCVRVNEKINGRALPLEGLEGKLVIRRSVEPYFQGGVIRYPVLSFGGEIYLKKAFFDLQRCRFGCLARYSMIPVVLVLALVRKLFRDRKGATA